MKCADIQERLSAYLDSELNEKDTAEVKEHLALCAKCRQSLAELEKTVEELKSLEQIEPPAWLSRKVMSRLREEQAKKGILQRLRDYWTVSVPVGAFATIMIIGIALYLFRDVTPRVKIEQPAPVPLQQPEPPARPGTEAPAIQKGQPAVTEGARKAELKEKKETALPAPERFAESAPAVPQSDSGVSRDNAVSEEKAFSATQEATAPMATAKPAPAAPAPPAVMKDRTFAGRRAMKQVGEPVAAGKAASSGVSGRTDAGRSLAFEFFDASGRAYRSTEMKESDRIVLIETPSLNDSMYLKQQAVLSRLHSENRFVLVVACTTEEYISGFHTTVKTAQELAGGRGGFRVRVLNGVGNVLRESNLIIEEGEMRRWLER